MHNLRFLIAEDSSVVRLVLSRIIRNRIGASEIYLAADGTSALEILKKQEIDFIIADWSLPDMNGEKLLVEIRKVDVQKKIPLIMLTTKQDNIATEKVLKLGASQHIVKPFKPELFEAKVRAAWNVTSKRKEERHSFLPRHEALLIAGDKEFPADVINISRLGALIRIHHEPEINIFRTYRMKLTVEIADAKEYIVIDPLVGKSIRLDSDECHKTASGEDCYIHRSKGGCPSAESRLCSLALCFIHKEMERHEIENLDRLIKWLASRGPDIVKDE